MEEPNPCPQNPKPEFVTLLKESLKTPFRNARITTSLLFASLPLLFFMFLFESLLEKILQEYVNISSTSTSYFYMQNYWFPIPYYFWEEKQMDMIWESSQKLIYLSLLYLFPLHLGEFLTAFLTIDLTSKIVHDDHSCSNTRIKDMILGNRGRLKGSFLTSLCVLFLSTCFLLGFIWLMIGYSTFYLTFALIYVGVFIASLPKYLELSAIWNLSLVVSVLKEVQGVDALSCSFYLCQGKEKLGRNLMLVFFLWSWGVRIPCLFFDDWEIGVVGRTSLLWLGSLMKWVVCVLYYHHCRSWVATNETRV